MPRSLPLETVEEIISYLLPAELAQCCLVSRLFLDLARPLLWQEIPLGIVFDTFEYEPDLEVSVSVYRYTQRALNLLEVLERNKHLRDLPQRVVLEDREEDKGAVIATEESTFKTIARLCPKATGLKSLVEPSFRVGAAIVDGFLAGRSFVRLDLGVFDTDDWCAVDHCQASLQHLAFTSTEFDYGDGSAFTSLRLRSLHVEAFRPFDDEPHGAREHLTRLTDSSSTTLTSLTIPFDLLFTPSLHTFSSLKHLTFTFLNDDALASRFEDLPTVISTTSTLRSLRLRMELSDRVPSGKAISVLCNPTHEGLAQKLPNSLGVLEIPAIPVPMDLIAFVSAIKAARLHTLVYSPVQEQMATTVERASGKVPFTGFEEVEDLCRTKGINLVRAGLTG